MTIYVLTAPYGRSFNKVECVKSVRSMLGCGLAEAKGFVDRAEDGQKVSINVDPSRIVQPPDRTITATDLCARIRFAGYEIVSTKDVIEQAILDAHAIAITFEQYETAAHLLEVIIRRKGAQQ
jgi:hypothetical protein